ncbi:related to Copper-transporting ATPase [Saccharomycodes ludwigii]|uniref:P-type Cu(+) transporter n=1 Tax=Saccharomycodes ludwigii TaxID=36035 RepID=A0A376B6E4_9ASCO|nr:related to Copper-transporting ATPase [Saccharomycodes ludwigii]
MTCSACVATITKQLENLKGVESVNVSLVTEECNVDYDSTLIKSHEDLIEVIEDCGFDANLISLEEKDGGNKQEEVKQTIKASNGSNINGNISTLNNDSETNRIHFNVQGMTCSACVATITKQLEDLNGVESVNVSLVTEECTINYDPAIIKNYQELQTIIEDCGFDASLIGLDENSDTSASLVSEKCINLKVFGMSGDVCVTTIESGLKNIQGISDCTVKLATENCAVTYNPTIINIRQIIAELSDLGFDSCVSSSLDNSSQLKILSRVREIQFWRHKLIHAGICSFLIMAIYTFIPMFFPNKSCKGIFPYTEFLVNGFYSRDLIGLLLASYVQFYLGGFFYKATYNSLKHLTGTMDTLVCISTTSAYLFSVGSILRNIYVANRLDSGRNNNMPMMSYPMMQYNGNNNNNNSNNYSEMPKVCFDTSTMLITFISLGKYLENKAKSQTSTALSKFMTLTPSTCLLYEASTNNSKEISVDLLEVGDIVEIKPGMKIPCDGIIVRGESEIDESLINGESLLVYKSLNDLVIGGSINGSGHFYFKATQVGDTTKLSNIIKIMRQAQLAKAPMQKYADYIASKFVPFVLLLALFTFITWFVVSCICNNPPKIFKESEYGAVYMCFQVCISVIVVACPCALGLAAPTAIMVGTGLGAKNGVLIKGGDVLQKVGKITTFLFDKTGTLTTGKMTIEFFERFDNDNDTDDTEREKACNLDDSTLWNIVDVVESISEHPVAKAIVSYARLQAATTANICKNINASNKLEILSSNIILGKGVEAEISVNQNQQTHRVAIGNKSMFDPQDSAGNTKLLGKKYRDTFENIENKTVAYLSIDGKLIGKFVISDNYKSDSIAVVQYLLSKNYKVGMVTGDNHKVANEVANHLGIPLENVYSEVSPSKKNEIVRYLQEHNKEVVCFIGDGVNDSLALVTSDLGVSISSGTDIAIEASNIVILDDAKNDSIKGLIYGLDISTKTFQRIKLNFFWAMLYNMLMLPIAIGVLIPWGITLHPMIAGLAMAFSSISVVTNSLMLNRWTPPDLHEDYVDSLRNNRNYGDGSHRFWLRLWKRFLSIFRIANNQDIEMARHDNDSDITRDSLLNK